ncbi:Uncharacterized protein QTN25_001587 [Entamoeba marina]
MSTTFILDIDGTLTSPQHENILSIDSDAIKTQLSKGNRVILATGRPLWTAKKHAKELGLEDILISSNGALSIRGNDILTYVTMEKEQALQVIEQCKKHKLNCFVVCGKHVNNSVEEVECVALNFIDKGEDILNLHLHAESLEEKERWMDVLRPIVGNKLVLKNSGERIIEVMSNSLNKGITLKCLNEQGLLGKRIVYVGDSENDIQAIQYVRQIGGIGIAMGNAFESVKKEASLVTKHVNEGGVAHALSMVEE